MPAKVLEIARREGKFVGEGWRVRKDGSRFWASVVVDRINDENGELIGFAKITRDMTEQREAQQATAGSRAAVPDPGPGRHRLCDLHAGPRGPGDQLERRCGRIKGYSPDEIMGEHFSRFYTPEDRDAGVPKTALETAPRDRALRGRRLARAKGRHPLLGERGDRRDQRRGRQADRLCQDHPRHDREARGSASPGGIRASNCSARRRWKRSAS